MVPIGCAQAPTSTGSQHTERAVITNLFVRRTAKKFFAAEDARNRNLICAPTIHHCHPRSGASLNSCRDLAAASVSRIVWARVIYRKVPGLGVIRNNRTVVRDCCFASPRDDVSSDVNGVPPRRPRESTDPTMVESYVFWKGAQQKRRIVERVNSFCALAHQLHYLSSREGIATLSYAEGHDFSVERVD